MLTFNNSLSPKPQITDAEHNWLGRIELSPPIGHMRYTERQQTIIGQFAVSSPDSVIQQVSVGVRADGGTLALVCRLEANNPSEAITTMADAVYGGLREAEISPRNTAISRLHLASLQDLMEPCSILQSADHQYTGPAVKAYDAARTFYEDYDAFISR